MDESQCETCFYNKPMTAWGETFMACYYRKETGKELYGDGGKCSGYAVNKPKQLSLTF